MSPPATARKFSLLFLFLLAYLILYPYMLGKGAPYSAFRVFGFLATALSVYAVSFRRRLVLFALVLAIPALFQRLILPRADAGTFSLLSVLLTFVFDVFIITAIFRRVFLRDEPTAENIFGALCVYLLAGFSFAHLYSMLASLQPHAFYLDPVTNTHAAPDRFDLIYYSFGTITCLGAPGITPVSNQARSLSVVEALLGILYLGVLISRLLSAYHHRETQSPASPPPS